MKTRNLILAIIALAMLGLTGCKKETITLSAYDLLVSEAGDTKTLDITANCDWALSIDDNADWFTVSPTTSANDNQGQLTIVVQPMEGQEYRNSSFTIVSAKGKASVTVKVTQKNEVIELSKYELWFPKEAETKTIEVTSNCKWTVTIDDNADWYTVSPMSGENGGCIAISVQPYEGSDYRSSSFTITSEHGFTTAKVFLSQNKLEFDEIFNMVFGVSKLERWNTDYFGQMIEDSYRHWEFNPYDTTTGYRMYFFEDGHGVQRDHHNDSVVYYTFTYDYNAANRSLYIEFDLVSDSLENYSVNVLTASEELFRFHHEYKPNFWERADMRKVGTITPGEKSLLMRAAKKRHSVEGIFKTK